MSDSVPLISVLMPVYNAERYVASAIDSILGQTLGDFEFLIVDDGSSDGSLAILRQYESRDRRIRVISRANTGHTRAINEMIALSAGKYVARMDADDLSLPDRFAVQVAAMDADPALAAVGGEVIWIDADGDEIRRFCVAHSHDEIDAAHLAGVGGAVSHPASMFRRAALLDVGGFREETHLAEDVDLFLRLAERGKLMNVNQPVLKWRLHPGSTGATRAVAQARVLAKVVRDAHVRRGLPVPQDHSAALPAVDHPGDTQRMWAWWALAAKNVPVARKLAWRALKLSPTSRASWITMMCAVRGY